MNSFLLIPFALFMFLIPSNAWAQAGTASSHPLHPLQLLDNPFEPDRYLQINYSSPYGVKSIQDIRLNLNQPTPRGMLTAEIQRIGIKGYSQFHFGLGYCLRIGNDNLTGVILNTDLFPVFA